LPRIKKKHRELKKFVGKRNNLSVSAPSVPAEQFSTSVFAEQLSAINIGVKRLHVVYAANDNFYGSASPPEPRGSYHMAHCPRAGKVPFPIKSAKYSYLSYQDMMLTSCR